MKINLRQVTYRRLTKKAVTFELKDILPALLEDLKMKFEYSAEELNAITSIKELKAWIYFRYKKSNLPFRLILDSNLGTLSEVDRIKLCNESLINTQFDFGNLQNPFENGWTLYKWLSLRRKSIMINNTSLDDLLNNTETIDDIESIYDSHITMLDQEGNILESRTIIPDDMP